MSAFESDSIPPTVRASTDADLIDLAREVLEIEASAITGLVVRIDAVFVCAVRTIMKCRGRVVVAGIGKSGHIARKIAATLASTGTPAFFIHSAEANHGDRGMITAGDVVIAISYSGESAELLTIVPGLKRQSVLLIAITGNPTSSLARYADIHLDASVEREACPLGLAPTASTTAALALGDALAVALLSARGFGPEDFARSHPGGKLGRRLLVRVADLMHSGADLPKVGEDSSLLTAVLEMSAKGLGMTAVVDSADRLTGVFTDGDLRRAIERGADLHNNRIAEAMTRSPRVIGMNELAATAVKRIEEARVNGLLVLDDEERLIGALNMHDLLRAGVV